MLKTPQAFDPRQEMNSQSYEIFYYKEPKATGVEVHHHDFYEVYNLIAGEVDFWVDGKIFHMRQGDIMLINPMELHRPIVDRNTQYERFVLWINKNHLDTLCVESDLSKCFQNRSNYFPGGSITPLFSQLVTEYYSQKYGSEIYAKGLFLQLMVELNRISPVGEAHTDRSALILNVIDYIGNHFSDDISLNHLAEKFHISKYHLSHEFKKETGTSLYHYITLKRLAQARQLLLDGHSPGEVFSVCGFRDYTVFYKAFKAEYGTSPTNAGSNKF